MNEGKYIDGLREEDPIVLRQYYAYSYNKLWPVLHRYTDMTNQVEDLFQESMFRLIQKIRGGEEIREGLIKFHTGIAKNIGLDNYKRKKMKEKKYDEYRHTELRKNKTFMGEKPKEADKKVVEWGINQLDSKCRDILKQVFIYNYTPAEVAMAEAKTIDSVKSLKKRCLKKLRKLLKEHIHE